LEKIFRPSQKKNSHFWAIILLVIIDVPFFIMLFLSFQGFSFLFVILTVVLFLVDFLVLSLSFLGRKMSFKIQKDNFLVHFGFSKRKIPFSTIKDVKLSKTTLLFRLFGASWPGLHWGLYKAKDIGKVWVYSTKMTGEFVVIELVDGSKIAVSPENLQQLYNELNTQRDRFEKSSTIKGYDQSTKLIYIQIASVATAFFIFLGYVFWIYPQLPESIPVHFDLNLIPNRWGHKSELFIIVSLAAIFPIINTIFVLKFGKYGKTMMIFIGIIFIAVITLFFSIVYFTQNII